MAAFAHFFLTVTPYGHHKRDWQKDIGKESAKDVPEPSKEKNSVAPTKAKDKPEEDKKSVSGKTDKDKSEKDNSVAQGKTPNAKPKK